MSDQRSRYAIFILLIQLHMRHTLLFIGAFSAAISTAQPGALDPTFSGDGILVKDLAGANDETRAVTILPDGRIVAAGWIMNFDFATPFVQQFLPDGETDLDFGTSSLTYVPGVNELRQPYAVDVQSTGAIIVAGIVYNESLDANAMLFRLLADGTLDESFGGTGFVSSDFGAEFGIQSAWAMKVLPDDRILVTGEEGDNGLVCVRFTADGEMDGTFGTGGIAYGGVPFSNGLCMDVQPDGYIVCGGFRLEGDPNWLLVRFDPEGELDPDFGTGGVVTVDLGGTAVETMSSVTIMPDGRIAACGYYGFNGLDDVPAVGLFLSDGTSDPSFDGDGVLSMPYPAPQWGQARAILAQPDGKLVVSGFRVDPSEPDSSNFMLMRLTDDGGLDPSFAAGELIHTMVTTASSRAYAMAFAPEHRILLAGYGTGNERATAYARYQNDIGMGVAAVNDDAAMSAYPLPVRDELFLHLPMGINSPVAISITDVQGRWVMSLPTTPDGSGTNLRIRWPQGLDNGTYVVGIPGTAFRTRIVAMR